MNKINLRVFKRDKRGIYLLWDRDKLPLSEYKERLTVWIEKGSEKYLANPIFKEAKKDLDTELLIVEHKQNELSPQEKCKVIVVIDENNPIAEYEVFPKGVLPDREKDEKDKNIHLMAWNQDAKVWEKLEGGNNENNEFSLKVKIDGLEEIKNLLKDIEERL